MALRLAQLYAGLLLYGISSSLLVNGIIIGFLLALSDHGVEPPPPPRPRGRLARWTGRSVRLETPRAGHAPIAPDRRDAGAAR